MRRESDEVRAVVCNHNAGPREVGMDIAGRKPKKLLREMQLHADWAVTMGCGDACPYVPTMVEAWDIPDPAGRPLEEIRELIDQHVRTLVEEKLDEIRNDRTAHELRLAQLLPGLAEEFEGGHTPEEIRECADAVLARFDEVPVRSHVLTLAMRQSRECLRKEHCDVLAPTA